MAQLRPRRRAQLFQHAVPTELVHEVGNHTVEVEAAVEAGIGEVDAATIADRTKADKKRVSGRHRFILAQRVGSVEIVDGVGDDEVRATVDTLQVRCG